VTIPLNSNMRTSTVARLILNLEYVCYAFNKSLEFHKVDIIFLLLFVQWLFGS
jgi:hypothetical protein